MKVELETYLTGTLAGAGSFRCRECGFAVALNALDEVPKCPNCGNAHFARSSMFDTSCQADAPDNSYDEGWLDAVRDDLESGHYLACREDGRVSVMPLMADTITTGGNPERSRAALTMPTTRAMASASATEVPPNFMTIGPDSGT